MKIYDVAIVGGGPIGGYTAKKIASKGYKVAILETKKEIGIPLKCAGLVTERVFDFVNIPKQNIVQNKIKGARIHSPSGKILSIGGDKVHALVIDRENFDKEIIKNATNCGAKLYLENKVTAVHKTKSHIEIKTSQNIDIKCKLLIGADGPYSKIRGQFSLSQPTEILRGIGEEITNTTLDPDFVEIFVGKNIAPGFFAWIIPTNKDGTEARIGLCTKQDASHPPNYYFSKFLENSQTQPFLNKSKITKNIGGVVPLGTPKETYASNILLVGDAAAQVKPTSGGGIYTGLLCAGHCSTVAVDALQKNNFTDVLLKKYQKLWQNDIGRELSRGMKFRRVFINLTDKQMDKYIEKFNNPKIIETINRYGDIDYPSKLVKPLITKNPSLIKMLPGLIKR